jgi:hypothetical protein
LSWTYRRARSYLREAKFRAFQASPVELGLDLLNTGTLGYQFWLTTTISVGPWQGWLFLIALIYSTTHRLWLKGRFQARKWSSEERRRVVSIGVAVSRIAACVSRNEFTERVLADVERGLLEAMQSEVEALVVDAHAIYLNATLLVEDPRDGDLLLCLNRGVASRPMHRTYFKPAMVAWRAMTERRLVYEPEFVPPANAPYHCVLAIPIISTDMGPSLGAVSIDSEQAHHFDGLESRIELKTLPYIELLKLVLAYRARWNLWLP